MTIKRALCFVLLALPAYAEHVGIAAIVNDDVISTTDVAERRALIMATNNIPDTAENEAMITPRVVDSLVDETIQLQEARRLSITVKPEELDAAVDRLAESRRLPPGTMRDALQKQGLSVHSMEEQMRAQLAWSKVVQRKLRREVSISQDEIARAQAAAAADPGTPEVQLAAISLLIPTPAQEQTQSELAGNIAARLRGGEPLLNIAKEMQGREDVRISPPGWVAEENLQPAMQQALHGMKPGEVSPPLKSLNSFQIIQLVDRRVTKKQPDSTEVAIKEIAIAFPQTRTKETMLALRESAEAARADSNGCMRDAVDVPGAKAQFVRTQLGALNPEVRSIISHLGVGEASAPLASDAGVRILLLCERIDPPQGNIPPEAEVRRQLFNEKIELEAQKHLRNLKRDAFIEIKDEAKPDDAS